MTTAVEPNENAILTEQATGLTLVDGLFVLALAAAAVARLAGLGDAPLGPGEAEQALTVWQFGQPGRVVGEIGSPAYFTLTTLLRPFLGDSDAIMRLVPALFGIATVALPWFLRDRIGRVGTAVAALLLAFSPLNTAVARTAGGESIAIFAVLLLAVGVLRLTLDGNLRWGAVAAAALGLGLASAPLFYSGLLTLAAAWLLQRLLGPRLGSGAATISRRTAGQMALVGLLVFLGAGTLFLWIPAGLGAAAELPAAWLAQFGFQGGLTNLLTPVLHLVRYEPLLALLGIFGIIWAVWGNRPLASHFAYWLLAALVLILFQSGVASNALLLTLPGALLLGLFTSRLSANGTSFWTWVMTGVVLLMGALLVANLSRYLRVAAFDPADLRTVWMILIGVVVTALALYYIYAIDPPAVGLGAWIGILVILLAYQWGTSWALSHGRALDTRERWITAAADDELPVLMSTLTNLSRSATNADADLDLFVTVDSAVLRWALRDFQNARFGSTLPTGTQASAIITPLTTAEPRLASDYLGSDFGVERTEESLTTLPPSPIMDTLRWWLFHESARPISENRVILWVRSDLAQ